jgi:hypothetical protein
VLEEVNIHKSDSRKLSKSVGLVWQFEILHTIATFGVKSLELKIVEKHSFLHILFYETLCGLLNEDLHIDMPSTTDLNYGYKTCLRTLTYSVNLHTGQVFHRVKSDGDSFNSIF